MRIALIAGADHGFALAGGNALVAHGLVNRPTQDVDLFSPEPGAPRGGIDAVRRALESRGYRVEVTRRPQDSGGEFAQLIVSLAGHRTYAATHAPSAHTSPDQQPGSGPIPR